MAAGLAAPFQQPLTIPPVLAPTSRSAAGDVYDIVMRDGLADVVPGFKTRVKGYQGLFPGPTLRVSAGRPALIRVRNSLSVLTSVHTHGAYADGDNDGHASDTIAPGGTKQYSLPNDQTARTMWYHDHADMITGANVNAGLAGFYLLDDAFEASLPLPRGEFDVPLLIQDRTFNANGQFVYSGMGMGMGGGGMGMGMGFMGETLLVNGKAQPFFQVANRRYRLRLLNGSNARGYVLRLSNGQSFQVIGSEGGLLERPVTVTSLRLAPAERYEVVVDFSKVPVGTSVVLQNGTGSGSTSQVMRFDVVRRVTDDSSVPALLRPAGEQVDPTHLPATLAQAVTTRRWDFAMEMMGGATINGKVYDPRRVDASPRSGDVEVWEFRGMMDPHPVHVHLVNFKILTRNGKPPPAVQRGWKETVLVNPDEVVRVLLRWPDLPRSAAPGPYRDRFMLHCHNLEHEDMGMMTQFRVQP